MTTRRVIHKVDNFDKAMALSTTPQGEFGWTIKDTSSAGTPTYLTVSGRGLVLTCDNTSEAQVVTAYTNDVLPFLLNRVQWFEFLASVTGVDAVTTLVMGLGAAQNDTASSVAQYVWARMNGATSTSAVVIGTKDGTTTNAAVSSGVTLSSTLKRFTFDFQKGLADVRVYVDGERVGAGTTLDMSAIGATQCLQPFVQLQKASGTGIPAVTIKRFAIQYSTAD